MKKITGMIIAMIMMGALLSGCYSKSCDMPASSCNCGKVK